MGNLPIGTNVTVNKTGFTGVVTGVDTVGALHVEHKDETGNLVRRFYISEEITVIEEGDGATGEGSASGASSPATTAAASPSVAGASTADTDTSGESSQAGSSTSTHGNDTALTGQAGESSGNGESSASGAAGEATDEVAAQNKAAAGAQPDDNMLLGSNVQPATFTLADDTVLTLGDVVAKAQLASGLSVADWNAQPEAEAEAHIQLEVDTLKLKEAEPA